jgi:hypothetical protein
MNYNAYTPQGGSDYLMILGHGFARGGETMTEWGKHFASWGITVLLPTNMCHYNILDGVDHELNGTNLMELANLHSEANHIYAGHSAGGLASLIAASFDPNAIGLIGLDTTDTGGQPGTPPELGQDFAPFVTVPAFSLIGEPSSCNTENNAIPLFDLTADSTTIRINDADHCDYENPTNWGCESFCLNQNGSTFTDDEIRPMIRKMGTAAAMSISGLHEDGEAYWSNQVLDEMSVSGLVQPL